MRTLAQESQTSRQSDPAHSVKPGRGEGNQGCGVDSMLHLQRAIGNQAVQRLMRSQAETRKPLNEVKQQARTNHSTVISRYVSPAVGTEGEPTVIADEDNLESCGAGQVSLYGPGGEPRQEHVDQERIGDCYLLSALAALTRTPRGRNHITSHIRPNPGGTYTVTLYSMGGQPQHVRMNPSFIPGGASRNPILAQGSGPQPQCIIWVALYERAVGHVRAGSSSSRNYYFGGMSLNSAFQMIAGSGFESWVDRGTSHSETILPNDAGRDEKIRAWRTIWTALDSGNNFVTVSTRGSIVGDGRLIGPHAYSVTRAYTSGSNYYIDLYNPHGAYVDQVDFLATNFQTVQVLTLSEQE